MLERVDDAAEEGHHEVATTAYVVDEAGGGGIADQVEVWNEHELVARQVMVWACEVRHHVGREERAVVALEQIDLLHPKRRLGRQLQRPPGLPVENDRDLGADPAPANGVEPPQLLAKLLHLTPGR